MYMNTDNKLIAEAYSSVYNNNNNVDELLNTLSTQISHIKTFNPLIEREQAEQKKQCDVALRLVAQIKKISGMSTEEIFERADPPDA